MTDNIPLSIKENTAREYVLQMGDIKAAHKSGVIICFGLGSCIGLFLYDRINKIAGGAHIMLPEYDPYAEIQGRSYYAPLAVEELLHHMASLGANLAALRAKLVGGAYIVNNRLMDMGSRNAEATLMALTGHRIFIASTDLGGNASRTARFDVASGNVAITSKTNTYFI